MFARTNQPAAASTEDAPLDSYHQALLDYQEKMLNGNSDSDASDVDDGTNNSTKSGKRNVKSVVSSIAARAALPCVLGGAAGAACYVTGNLFRQKTGSNAAASVVTPATSTAAAPASAPTPAPASSGKPISKDVAALFGSRAIYSCKFCMPAGSNPDFYYDRCTKKDGTVSNCAEEFSGYVSDPQCLDICNDATSKKDTKCSFILDDFVSGGDGRGIPAIPLTCGDYTKQYYIDGDKTTRYLQLDYPEDWCSNRSSSPHAPSKQPLCAVTGTWQKYVDYQPVEKTKEPKCGDTYTNPICFNTKKNKIESYEYFQYERSQPHTFPLCKDQCDGSHRNMFSGKWSSCAFFTGPTDVRLGTCDFHTTIDHGVIAIKLVGSDGKLEAVGLSTDLVALDKDMKLADYTREMGEFPNSLNDLKSLISGAAKPERREALKKRLDEDANFQEWLMVYSIYVFKLQSVKEGGILYRRPAFDTAPIIKCNTNGFCDDKQNASKRCHTVLPSKNGESSVVKEQDCQFYKYEQLNPKVAYPTCKYGCAGGDESDETTCLKPDGTPSTCGGKQAPSCTDKLCHDFGDNTSCVMDFPGVVSMDPRSTKLEKNCFSFKSVEGLPQCHTANKTGACDTDDVNDYTPCNLFGTKRTCGSVKLAEFQKDTKKVCKTYCTSSMHDEACFNSEFDEIDTCEFYNKRGDL